MYCVSFQVLNSGWLNRRVASTSMNRESSRSHAVFTITLESKVGSGESCILIDSINLSLFLTFLEESVTRMDFQIRTAKFLLYLQSCFVNTWA